jgi:cellulose synthase/poly-beta-1,6-N-acetylglucosamine synthase-like glycosyltransferase
MKYPKISVVMPAYKEEEVIGETLRHILEEVKYPNIEVIVAVDTEEDNTYKIAKSFAKRHRNLKIDFSKERRGFVVAINSALQKATGDILVKSDAEVRYLNPNVCMFSLVKYFEDKKVGGVRFKWKPYSPDLIAELGKGWSAKGEIFMNELVSDWWESKNPVIKGNWNYPLVCNAFRRKLVPKLDPKIICDDGEYGYNVLKKGYKIVFAKDIIHYFVGVPGDMRRLFLQKRRGAVGWFQMSECRKVNLFGYYSKFIGYYLTHFYKYSLEEAIAFLYWCSLYVFILMAAYSKRKEESKSIWVKYKRDVKK